ncbi:MAG TPA: AI-2E family transporter [Solirubrobacterales bacterium]|nr:AI-2E family transporter [Solirubrobacterales bacterium]
MADVSVRGILKVVLTVVVTVLLLYLIYLLRKPITWLFIAMFLAVALSAPVNALNRHMKRGFAIGIVYLALFGAVALLVALLVPPIVNEANDLADNAPEYVQDVRDYVEKNESLREINNDYQITDKLDEEAAKLPEKLGGAAGVLRDIGFGIVNGIFAFVTIMVLTAFMLSGGPQWRRQAMGLLPPERAQRIDRVLDHMSRAVSGYVAGALIVALIAGISTFVVLSILGVGFAAPLGLVAGLFSLVPLVGATIAAVLIGLVTLFSGDFPTDTILWAIWAIVYQQIENNLIQPQVQKRTVNVNGFIVLVSVLFGATLLGVLGALVAIPIAASIQIVIREWWEYRRENRLLAATPPPPGEAGPEPASA